MKKSPIFVLLFVSCILFSSCTKTIPPEKIQIRNGIAYEVNSKTPFTGLLKCTDSTNLYETEYKNGKKEGTHREYYRNGSKKNIIHFHDGLKEGLEESFFANGQKQNSVTHKRGMDDGESIWYLENGQIKDKFVYSNDSLVQIHNWFENGQKKNEIYFPEGKLSKLIYWYENGKYLLNFQNDKISPANKMTYYNEKGDLFGNAYYLNARILPMESIFSLPDVFKIQDIVRIFGIPEENKNSMPQLKYSNYRYYSIDPQSGQLINKALLKFTTGIDKQGKETSLGIQIIYYNKTSEEDAAVNTEMHNYLIKLGFAKDQKKDKYYDKARNLTVEIILRMNNNTMYAISKKNSK